MVRGTLAGIVLMGSVLGACAEEARVAEGPLGEETSHFFTSLSYSRVVLDAEGHSDFGDGKDHFELKDFAPPASPLGVAQMRDAKSLVFTTADPGWGGEWHPSPRKQFVFMLKGSIEIEVQDGETRRFSQGDVIMLEDTSGRGHDTRVVGASPALFALVGVPE